MQTRSFSHKVISCLGFGAVTFGVAAVSRAVLVTDTTTGSTIFADNFETAPEVSSAPAPDNSVDADPVAQTGTWDTQDGSPPSSYGLEVQVTNYNSPGAFQGSNYLRLYRSPTHQQTDTYAQFSTTVPTGDLLHFEAMVYLPSSTDVNARMQLMFEGSEGVLDSTSVWVRPDGNGNVDYVTGNTSAVVATGLHYSTNTWQKWSIDYATDSSTYTLSVGGATVTDIPVNNLNGVADIHFGNGSNTEGAYYLDATSATPEPSMAGVAAMVGLMTFARRGRARR